MSLDTELPLLDPEIRDGNGSESGVEGRKPRGIRRGTVLLPRRNAASEENDGRLGWRALIVVGACFFGLSFAQSPGLIEFDTKLPLNLVPLSYFDSLLRLWNPTVFGGTVEQGVGFLMPQGVFYAVAYFLHIPVWITERIWLGAILTVACWGIVRLAEALAIGNRRSRIIAGVAYCVAPIVLTWVSTTGDLLAVAFLPWLITPLVHGSRGGSTRRAAAKSGLAFALMGGANAAVVVATLPVALIWLITRTAGPRRRSLTAWWVVAVGAASFWWLAGLVYVQHFGYNYLPYTETSATTTSTASAFEALRGASYWINYFNLGGPLLRGPWILVSVPVVIIATAAVTAFGLAGLCRRIPERLFLVSCLVFGVVAITAGYPGAFGGPFSHTIDLMLQHSLAPFRNVSKFTPAVTLPLVLGLAWTLAAPWEPVGKKARQLVPNRRMLRIGVTVFALIAVLLAAFPFVRGEAWRGGGFSAIPSYWDEAGAFLNEHQGHENALMVPGSAFGYYTWGNPVDEPLQVVASTSIEWRNIIPEGSNGYNQMLDAVEQSLDGGTATPTLADYLAREGVNYVVERNDLNIKKTGAPPPAQVHQVLSETPGLTQVASFGPYLPLSQVAYGQLPVYDSTSALRLRPVEIFRVDPATPSAVQTFAASNPVVVSGDLSSVMQLAGDGILHNRVAILNGDSDAKGVAQSAGATAVVTDGNQRRDLSFGSVRLNQSYLLVPKQKLPGWVSGVPTNYAVVAGEDHQTASEPIGARSVSASSFGQTPLLYLPPDGPGSAFDNDPTSSWVADASNNSVGQWVGITFDKPIKMSTIMVKPLEGSSQQPTISAVRITTDQGSVIRHLPRGQTTYTLRVPAGASRHLKVTLVGVRNVKSPIRGGIILSAGITSIAIPGVTYQQRMLLPDDEAPNFSSSAANATEVELNRPVANQNLSLGIPFTDDPSMNRSFTLPKGASYTASGVAIPRPGPSLDSLLQLFTAQRPGTLQVTSSSSLGALPKFSPENLVDNSTQPWIAEVGDTHPSLHLAWPGRRSVSEIALTPALQAARPTKISVTPDGSRTSTILRVPSRGTSVNLTFPPAVTDGLTIKFLDYASRKTVTPNFGVEFQLPVGLQAVALPALLTTPASLPDMNQTFALKCGEGPTLDIDGKATETSVSGTLGDLIDLKPVLISVCTPTGGLALGRGSHSFGVNSDGAQFLVTSLLMKSVTAHAALQPAHRTATIRVWGPESRTVSVGAGPATYLVLAQNYNPGWVAKMGATTLAPMRVDGWEQAYLVPAGNAGTVRLDMQANGLYEILLVIGAALLIGLLVLALLPGRRAKRDPAGLGSRPLPNFWLLLALSGLALVIVAGPWSLVLVPLLVIARRWGPTVMAITAFAAFFAAGILAAWNPASPVGPGADAFGGAAEVASVVALAALLASLVAESWSRGRKFEMASDGKAS